LASYTLSELKGVQHNVKRANRDRQQQDVQKIREQILAIDKDASVCLEELFGNGGATNQEVFQRVPSVIWSDQI